jgi:hypothetical protein
MMRNILYAKGFTTKLWKNITNVEILKKADLYDIALMWTIQLMNLEQNMNNKKAGWDLMTRGENCKLITQEQYGSRKKYQSITAPLNKQLMMDLLRQQQQAGALCSNDVKSCYDWLVHSMTCLAMWWLGALITSINSVFKLLQQAAHWIRTAFGTSKKKYGDEREIPLQGLGQGNGSKPVAGWAIISTPIIGLMCAIGFIVAFWTVISVSLMAFACYTFINDTGVMHMVQDVYTNVGEILKQMQAVMIIVREDPEQQVVL